MLLYLTPSGWNSATDGGELRIHPHAHLAHAVDVPPRAGSLCLFDSATVPHEVLPTQRGRLVVAGWLLEEGERVYQ